VSDDEDDLLARFGELLTLVRSGEITSLAWVATDAEGETRVAATGDQGQLLEALELLQESIREASPIRAKA
jgi:hypothetical protein